MTLTDRYKVVDDSLSKHCCFGYTVVDTQHVDREDEIICECFEEGFALMIATALNNKGT